MLAAAYLRVSKAEDGHDTIENQRPLIEKLCRERGFRVHDFYEDDDVSGKIPMERRPEGARLFADARLRAFDTVVVWRVDRLGRDTRQILNAAHDLKSVGLKVVSATEAFDTTTSAGELMFEMLASFAAHERRTILERSKAGCLRSVGEGAYHGGVVAYGYRVEGERRNARLVPNEEPFPGIGLSEAAIVRWLYHHIAVERGTTCSAAQYLNGLGVPTRYALGGFTHKRTDRAEPSGRWRPAAIYNIVTKPLYRGVWPYVTKGGETVERAVPALVEEETWHRAQAQLRQNCRFSRRNGKRDYLLRGLVRCAHCGRTYTGSETEVGGKRYPRYACHGSTAAGEKCPGAGLPAVDAEARVWEHLCSRVKDRARLIREIEKRLQEKQQDGTHLLQEREAVQRELAGKEDERGRLFSLYRRGRMEDAELDRQLDEVKAEEMALHRRLNALECDLRDIQDKEVRLHELQALAETCERLLENAHTPEEKRQTLELMVDTVWAETVERVSRCRAKVRLRVEWSLGDTCIIASNSRARVESNYTFNDLLLLAA